MKQALGLRVFLPFAFALLLSYFYRSLNAVLESYLRADIDGLSNEDIGLITGSYFLAFALFQLPLGLLLDRYGPRRVETVLLLLAAGGAALFAAASGMPGLFAGRLLTGLGMSACLMASFKAFSIWYPADRLAVLNGWAMGFGSLGMLLATAPLQLVLEAADWRAVLIGTGVVTLAAAAWIFFAVPEGARSGAVETRAQMLSGLKAIWSNPVFWRIMPFSVTANGGAIAMQSLWLGPWLLEVRGLDETGKGLCLLVLAIGQFCALMSAGFVERVLKRFGWNPIAVAIGFSVYATIMLAVIAANPVTVPAALLLAVYSVAVGGAPIMFAAMTRLFPAQLSGRLTTSMNLMFFGTVFAAQWGIGAMIDVLPGLAGITAPASLYGLSFGALVLVQIVAFGWLLAGGGAWRR